MLRVFTVLFAGSTALSAAPADFKRDIQPIFQSRCYECHGEKKQKNGIRFDRKSSVFEGGDAGKPLIIPGKSAESTLVQRLITTDDDEVMPPKGERLTADQIALIRAWIDQGAAWPEERAAATKHWAYEKPVRPALPKVRQHKWPINAVDYFALEKLEREKLRPSLEADRATLIRRVSLDLTGLPPSLQEVDDFLNDKSLRAYETVVDRLLASPQYGERWARLWLDLARYADTQGYEKDDRRNIWPYRDWVINALNRDLPFDQFTIDQLAGDLLPDAAREQKVATGFHRNTLTNTEGGTDDEEFRHEAVVDRVNTTMSVWMGSTFNCAQCHNHKYDPFTMRDYYHFYALLNQTADADRPDETPILKLPTLKQEAEAARLTKAIAEAEKEYNAETPEFAAARAKWEETTKQELAQWPFLDIVEMRSAGGATFTKTNDQSIIVSGTNAPNDVYTIVARTSLKHLSGLRLEVMPDASLPKKSVGRHPNGSFVLTSFEVALTWRDELHESQTANNPSGATNGTRVTRPSNQPITFAKAEADYSQEKYSVTNLISGGKTNAGWATSAGEEKGRVERMAWFTASNRTELPDDATLTITLRHDSKYPEANLGRFRLSATGIENVTAPLKVPEKIRTFLASTSREENDTKELDKYFRSVAPELKKVRDTIADLRRKEGELDKAIARSPVMEAVAKPRDTHMLIRGGFLSKGEKVQPAFPGVFGGTPNEKLNRLDLARWLVSEGNPMTARVMVNRIWEEYFGVGIVETSEDFGTQGESPSHPALLDWLATEFMRGWSLKAIHKTIVMSATYRQSSKASPKLLQRDPYNRLLARGPRLRLEAEMIRDQALAISGLLSKKMGGPSVFPPQPDGLWQMVYSGDKWDTSKGDDRYRRGLYTFWRRTMPHPAMTTFDAPSREFCVVKRTRSNTPLQALNLLNDPAYIEAAQALARRLVAEGGATDPERIAFGLRLCLARAGSKAEIDRLTALYHEQFTHFKNNSDAARKMAGEKCNADEAASLAAWTVVANVLLNLDELITKG
jgi:mono/diheme cytochrome c family protein